MATTLAQLTARADGGQFTFTVQTPTPALYGTSRAQPRLPVKRGGANVLVSWTGIYRAKRWFGDTLVADAGLSALAQQTVLDEAWAALDAIDLRFNQLSRPYGGVAFEILDKNFQNQYQILR